MEGALRIGTSGYQYRHWKEIFYPKDLPTARWFEFYAQRFDTVEINSSYYHLPPESVFDSWRERAPDDFIYAVKYSRFATHMKKLKDPEAPLELFVSRAERLRDHLGPILVQLPPRWKRNPERLAEFLSAAPEKYRWAIEFRDPSWLVEEIFRILRHHNAALCIHDMIDHHPWAVTADWCYLRFHGGPGYDQGYTDRQLGSIADRVRTLTNQGTDVFTYFNNDAGGHAFRNALTLRELFGLNRTKVAA